MGRGKTRELGEVSGYEAYETHTQSVSGLWSNLIYICRVEENLSVAMWQPYTGYSGFFVFLLFIWKTSQIIALFWYTCVMHETLLLIVCLHH